VHSRRGEKQGVPLWELLVNKVCTRSQQAHSSTREGKRTKELSPQEGQACPSSRERKRSKDLCTRELLVNKACNSSQQAGPSTGERRRSNELLSR
jgi:hypothetical protein